MAVVGQQTPLEALAEQRAQTMAMHDPDLVPAAVRTRDGLPAIDPKVSRSRRERDGALSIKHSLVHIAYRPSKRGGSRARLGANWLVSRDRTL
jgi:hypothetical protein